MPEHSEAQRRHEAMYRKTIDSTVRSIRENRFTEEAVPRVLDGLRAELGQCIELLLISSEFYSEQMEKLQIEVAHEMDC